MYRFSMFLPGEDYRESFRKKCQFDMERKGNILEIDDSKAMEELARSLEKVGIAKVKGGSIKWTR